MGSAHSVLPQPSTRDPELRAGGLFPQLIPKGRDVTTLRHQVGIEHLQVVANELFVLHVLLCFLVSMMFAE